MEKTLKSQMYGLRLISRTRCLKDPWHSGNILRWILDRPRNLTVGQIWENEIVFLLLGSIKETETTQSTKKLL